MGKGRKRGESLFFHIKGVLQFIFVGGGGVCNELSFYASTGFWV